jgi:hypothetical protein
MPVTADLTLTPNASGAGSLDFMNASGTGAGIHVDDSEPLELPLPAYEDFFAETADGEGSPLIGFRDLNPSGSIPLRIEGSSVSDFWARVTSLQKVVAEIRRLAERKRTYGGTLVWTPPGGVATTYQIVSIRLAGLPQTRDYAIRHATARLEFTCLPYGLLDTVTLVTNANGSEPLLSFELANVPGHVDALLEILVTDTASKDRWHAEYGIEEDYNPAAPTDLILDSDELSTAGLAGVGATRTGAYDPGGAGNSVIRGTLSSTAVAICSTGAQSHTGLRRIKGRLYADTALTYARLEYRIGDGPWNKNAWVLVLEDNFSERDLGLVYVPSGETWEGRIVGKCVTAGAILDVDYVLPFPADRYGKARRVLRIETSPVLSARDEFNQSAGVLHGKNLPVGGAWATSGSFGDYSVDSTKRRALRSEQGDGAGLENGRFALAGTTGFTSAVAQVLTESPESQDLTRRGLVLRYIDASNFVVVVTETLATATLPLVVQAHLRVAGVTTSLLYREVGPASVGAIPRILRVYADAQGRLLAWLGSDAGLPRSPIVAWERSELATGGALASGKIGLFDHAEKVSGTPTREYDDFMAWVPEPDAVCFSGQSLRNRHNVAERENAAGTRWGRVPRFEGEHARCPPAGPDNRTYRGVVKLRRNDIDELVDENIADSVRVDVTATPRVLLVSG